ncbi:MAG: ROK family protein [Burkholderiales bacterium]|nr:ROK family protein [Burkholderiales bacterium]
MVRIGVDIGGTKIEIIALGDEGRVLLRRRIDTPPSDYGALIASVAALVLSAERELGESGTVGVGPPGSPSRVTGFMRNSNSPHLNGRPLLRDLERALAREVRIENDANCFALSEASDGAGAGAEVVFGVILGTGVGAGVVAGGRLLRGVNGIAGEWGHNPLPALQAEDLPLPQCYCGRRGCVETYLSGPALARDFASGRPHGLDARGIAAAAAGGDRGAAQALERYARRLARSLAVVVNILDPDVIVLGGGMSNLAMLYERLPALWQAHVFSDREDTRLARNRHGDSSGVRGAAWLWELPAAVPPQHGGRS